MKLLICTQVMDRTDSTLGFFHRWVEEFAAHCESVQVICLREGDHSLPRNVEVHSLGKERGGFRVARWLRAFYLAWTLRKKYDAVFVHMNTEYVVLNGLLWRLLRKKIALWYVHKSVTLRLRIAAVLAHVIFTASSESFRLKSRKVRIVGHGIDTTLFVPDARGRGTHYLSVGRLMKSKRHDLAIRKAKEDGRELRIAGEGPERASLESAVLAAGTPVQFLGGLTQMQLREEYRQAGLLLHMSETGSLDKVVLEALACDLPIFTRDPALKPLESEGAAYVREHHSLSALIPRILEVLS